MEKRQLAYPGIMIVILLVLCVALVFGWFAVNKHVGSQNPEVLSGGVLIEFFRSTDEDGDGRPDLDAQEKIIFVPEEPVSEFFAFVPGEEVHFRVEITAHGRPVSGELRGLTAASQQLLYEQTRPVYGDTNPAAAPVKTPVDLADVLWVKYTHPVTKAGVDCPLSGLFGVNNRDAVLFSEFGTPVNGMYEFTYIIYMPDTVTAVYMNRVLMIEEAIFFAAQR